MSDAQVMEMPIARFWLMNASIDRISAQEDLRAARRAVLANANKEYVNDYFRSLVKEIGAVVVREDVPDYEGIQRLKSLASMFKRQ
jgi:hypothetical protein